MREDRASVSRFGFAISSLHTLGSKLPSSRAVERPVSDDGPSIRARMAPPSERPEGIWFAPIKGVFFSPFEKWANPFEEDRFEFQVEPGVEWRSTTEEDRGLMVDWFDFYREAHSTNVSQSMTWADTVLRSTEASVIEDQHATPSKVIAFMLALSLRTRAPLSTQLLWFELEQTPNERFLPHSGYPRIETVRLAGWPLQQQLGKSELAAVPDTYAAVWKIFQQPIEHGLRRCLGAYRAAVASVGFVDAVPILACAALEALAAAHKSGRVIERVTRYSSTKDAASGLASFYRLRQWFAHGADIPEMRDLEVRVTTVEAGLSLVKEIIVAALQDSHLFAAATLGGKAVKDYLEG